MARQAQRGQGIQSEYPSCSCPSSRFYMFEPGEVLGRARLPQSFAWPGSSSFDRVRLLLGQTCSSTALSGHTRRKGCSGAEHASGSSKNGQLGYDIETEAGGQNTHWQRSADQSQKANQSRGPVDACNLEQNQSEFSSTWAR